VERGVPAEKVHVIYNWCDEELFRPRPRDERLAAALGSAGRFNVVYAGNLGMFQGVETMVRAARLVVDEPDIQVVFVGTGQEEERAKALAREIGATNVRFLSRRPMEEMPAINDLADVLLVHLIDRPVFRTTVPSKTQVSLASGRAVLMAVHGDAADVVEDAGAGLVCAPEDPEAMAAAIRTFHAMDRDRREALGASGRAYYLRHMSLAVGGAATDALLRDAVARARR
jgi:glycosyltransferase involved in cell wall biosynthesis